MPVRSSRNSRLATISHQQIILCKQVDEKIRLQPCDSAAAAKTQSQVQSHSARTPRLRNIQCYPSKGLHFHINPASATPTWLAAHDVIDTLLARSYKWEQPVNCVGKNKLDMLHACTTSALCRAQLGTCSIILVVNNASAAHY